MNVIKQFILFSLIISAKIILAQEVPIKYYSLKDGLAHSMVADIYQDKEGNIWFPTYGGGLSMFNGEAFKNYGLQNGLTNLVTRSIAEFKRNEFIIGTIGGGLFILKDDTITKIYQKLPGNEIFNVHVDSKNNIWAGTEKGLFKIKPDSTIENISLKYNLPEYAVIFINEDSKGNIWFGYDSEHGLYKLNNNNNITIFNQKNGLTNERILSTFHDSDENTWVGAHNGMYLISKGSNKANKIKNDQLPNYYIFNFSEPINGLLIMGSQDKGIVLYNRKENKVIKTIQTNNGLKVSTVFRVFADKENNIWFSNWGEGVANIHFNGWTRYNEKCGLEDRFVYSVNEINGKLFVTTATGVFIKEGNIFRKVYKEHLKGGAIDIFSYKNEVLIATEKELIIIKNKKARKLQEQKFVGIRSALIGNDGNLYLAGWGCGILKYNGSDFTTIDDTLISEIKYFYSCFKDSKGNLWFASYDAGLVGCVEGKWMRYTTENGLPINMVTCVTEDKNGNLIVGTNGGGIASIRYKKVKIFNTLNGLPSNIINSLLVDNENNVWAGLPGSIVKLKLATGKIEIISDEIGFEGDCLNSSILEVNNEIWVGTNNYLWKFDKSDVIKRKNNLTVILNEIKVNDTKIENKYIFDSYENKFNFNFYTTQIYNRKNIKYIYRLIGLDSVFTKPAAINEITFHELPSGKYSFEVKAVLDKTIFSESSIYSFTIKPPFYKTWWFLILSIGAFFIILKVYISVREKSFIKKQKELESIVKIRTEEITTKNAELEEKQKEILDSIQYAKRIQYTLLAHDSLLKENLKGNEKTDSFVSDYFVFFKPKDIVSGDFYWATKVEEIDTTHFYLAVCDSTGHGVPGAFMSLLNISFLNEAISEKKIYSPGNVLNYVRQKLIDSISKEGAQDGMDGILLKISKTNGKTIIEYAAANNAPVILSQNKLENLDYDKMPVGMSIKNDDFINYTVNYTKNSLLFLYTDGYADQFGGPKGKKFKYKQLNELLTKNANLPLEEQKELLKKEFESWKGNLEQVDDVCIIGIKL